MTRFVAFLRGINVGGRVVTKDKLQGTFRSLAFGEVATYKQGGNVVFVAGGIDPEKARTRIEGALRESLGFEVSAFIRTIEELRKIAGSAPKLQCSAASSLLVTLLPRSSPKLRLRLPLTIPKSTAQVISATRTEVFSETHGGGEGALPNPFVESKLGKKTTTRNMNVIREILERYPEGV